MTTLIDNPGTQIARRLRMERDRRGWSLAELAERSGVSKATISKIEREEVSPTAVILVRLAGAFDLTLAGLLLRAEGEGRRLSARPTSRSGATPRRAIGASRSSAGPIIPWRSSRSSCRRGKRVVLPASSYAHIRQAIWVQKGKLVILEGGERHLLSAGDCLGFGPPSEVTLANETAAPCTYLVLLARS